MTHRAYALPSSRSTTGERVLSTYLWFDNVRSVPGAEDALAEVLSSEHRPRFVAEYQSPALCDPSGRAAELLSKHYRRSTTIDSIPILETTTET